MRAEQGATDDRHKQAIFWNIVFAYPRIPTQQCRSKDGEMQFEASETCASWTEGVSSWHRSIDGVGGVVGSGSDLRCVDVGGD